ncbi:hypothetical protein QSJ19_10900 [Gordonia sp. ABSL11-1]|uniref:hypothetical protein n=1 Tax=Gordonia sp. ABSL11-1 TaxID=3053924 RepID=UPI002573E397|nr:hypothetical protein [Gordonia sp. ABSL11-1]MDL9946092.1 hypothetical protein [Gordonia sp. ABSL11-1]
MFVLTVDQRGSRTDVDRVDDLLMSTAREPGLLRPFERTAGDEVQGVADSATVVARLAIMLVADGHWSVGIGIGGVDLPLPMSTRSGRGPAFVDAREAVESAKRQRVPISVRGGVAPWTHHAQTAARLLADVAAGRSDHGAEAVRVMQTGVTQAEGAEILGITPQAMSQRLRSARWDIDDDGCRLVTELLSRADGTTDPRGTA